MDSFSHTGDSLQDQDQFVREMTRIQSRLFAYILTMLPNVDQAADVLQETNVIMWRKGSELGNEQSFEAWACRIAYYEVLGFRRNRLRDRHLFSEELIERVSEASLQFNTGKSAASQAVEHCLGKLSKQNYDLIRQRYQNDVSIEGIAQQTTKTPGAVTSALHRIRCWLRDCIAHQLQQGAAL